MDLASWLAAVALAVTFAVAAYGKARDPEGTQGAVEAFGVRSWATRDAIAFLLPIAELLVALALLIPPLSVIGAMGAVALLLSFIVAIGWNLVQGRRPDCHCFGQVHSAPIGPMTIVRNLVLTSLGALVVVGGGGHPSAVSTWWNEARDSSRLAAIAIALAGSAIVLSAGRFVRSRRSTGPAGGGNVSSAAIELGGDAPPFDLEEPLAGARISSADLCDRGRQVLIVFASATCGPCESLFPDLASWQSSYPNIATVAVLSSGHRDLNLAKAAEHGLREILLEQTGKVGVAYGITATPSAIVIDERGRIASGFAVGPDAIRHLFRSLVSAHVSGMWEAATGLQVDLVADVATLGERVPPAELLDLNGRAVEPAQLWQDDVILVFWSPDCGYCAGMRDDIEELSRDPSVDLVVISQGSRRDNRRLASRTRVLIDPSFELGRVLGVQGTPSAVRILKGGEIGSVIAMGRDAIVDLARGERVLLDAASDITGTRAGP